MILIACAPQESTEQKRDHNPEASIISYKQSVFLVDDRAQKIREIAPSMKQLIEDHASERNIPGIAYGIVVDGELVVASSEYRRGNFQLQTF